MVIACGEKGDNPVPRTAEEVLEFISEFDYKCPPPDWLLPFMKSVLKNEDQGAFEIVRARELSRIFFPCHLCIDRS